MFIHIISLQSVVSVVPNEVQAFWSLVAQFSPFYCYFLSLISKYSSQQFVRFYSFRSRQRRRKTGINVVLSDIMFWYCYSRRF
jgi:hypothetical protein